MQAHSSVTVATSADWRTDGARRWDSLMPLARIGATGNGGVCRLALIELDRDAHNPFIAWAKEIDCTMRVDAIGNIFSRQPGLRDDLPPVMTGSRIDTQPTGGEFDGNYGVLAGLERRCERSLRPPCRPPLRSKSQCRPIRKAHASCR
jgi:N-carbamoyl-L-amino-acid hydrolase